METLDYTCANGMTTITLNRPDARNALSAEMVSELDTVLGTITRDNSVRALILLGAGGAF